MATIEKDSNIHEEYNVMGMTPLDAFMEEHNENRAKFSKIETALDRYEKNHITVREYKKQVSIYNEIIKCFVDIIIKLFILSISVSCFIFGYVLMELSKTENDYKLYEIGAPLTVCAGCVSFVAITFILITIMSYNKDKRKRR